MRVVAAVLQDAGGRVLLAQRPPGKQHAGQWEFPGGKVEPEETARAALSRELGEELGIEVESAAHFMSVRRLRGAGELVLEAWRVPNWSGKPVAHEHSALRWLEPEAALALPLCDADVPICRTAALPGCYAITPEPGPDLDAFFARIVDGLSRGLRLLQWRAPHLPADRYRDIALKLRRLAHDHGAKLMLNADLEFALALGADGVHLNASRLRSLDRLPARPPGFLVAASVHDAEELSRAAAIEVDFAVISPVRPTRSHPGQGAIGWTGFEALRAKSGLPAYALGGLGPLDVEEARAHGALGVAGISAFW
jgi:8-oxo-dGTP diphosphatase